MNMHSKNLPVAFYLAQTCILFVEPCILNSQKNKLKTKKNFLLRTLFPKNSIPSINFFPKDIIFTTKNSNLDLHHQE